MLRRTVFHLLAVLLLTASVSLACIAQTGPAPQPDEGVRGSGTIAIQLPNGTPRYGIFDINVARFGASLAGGFKYAEADSNSTRGHTIYSQRITALNISGNFAEVWAEGFWNNMPSIIRVEALDDLNDDWFHITAWPQGMLPIIYDASGGVVRGDIVVYQKAVPQGFAKGEGTIQVDRNIGRFRFAAELMDGQVKGSIYYVEASPLAAVNARPRVQIYVPEVRELRISGISAVLAGPGTLNGRPAMVEVQAVDWSPAYRRPDEFYIRAQPLSDDWSRAHYEAGGPLTTGEIVVKGANAITP